MTAPDADATSVASGRLFIHSEIRRAERRSRSIIALITSTRRRNGSVAFGQIGASPGRSGSAIAHSASRVRYCSSASCRRHALNAYAHKQAATAGAGKKNRWAVFSISSDMPPAKTAVPIDASSAARGPSMPSAAHSHGSTDRLNSNWPPHDARRTSDPLASAYVACATNSTPVRDRGSLPGVMKCVSAVLVVGPISTIASFSKPGATRPSSASRKAIVRYDGREANGT